MVKICPEHGLMLITHNYCHECGKRLWCITEEEFKKGFEFETTEQGKRDYIKWLKERHPEVSEER